MGEIAESSVISWLKSKKKFVKSAVDKQADSPDLGHDLWLKASDGRKIKCSIKSSLSAKKSPKEILKQFTIATKQSEIREVNIQVYFWLDIEGKNRITVPTTNHCAIICWCGPNDIKNFNHYNTEKRQAPSAKLREQRTMESLLQYLS